MYQSIFFTKKNLSLSVCIFFLSLNLQAQPWADCDTIRIFSIALSFLEDPMHEAFFQNAVDNIVEESGIPIKVVGYHKIVDDSTTQFMTMEQNRINSLNSENDANLPEPLRLAIEDANENYQPDFLIFKTKFGVGNTAVLSNLELDFPKRAWYLDTNSSEFDDKILAGYAIVRLTGYSGNDDSEPNLMNSLGITPITNDYPTNLTPATVLFMNENYQANALAPNDIRDCGGPSSSLENPGAFQENLQAFPEYILIRDLKKGVQYQLINPLGQALLAGKLSSGDHQVSFSNIPNGLYYFGLSDGTKASFQPVWIQH